MWFFINVLVDVGVTSDKPISTLMQQHCHSTQSCMIRPIDVVVFKALCLLGDKVTGTINVHLLCPLWRDYCTFTTGTRLPFGHSFISGYKQTHFLFSIDDFVLTSYRISQIHDVPLRHLAWLLFQCGSSGNLSEVERIVRKTPDSLHVTDTRGRGLLHVAAAKGKVVILEFGLQQNLGTNLNERISMKY